MTRPTHRLTAWYGPDAEPRTIDLVVADGAARTLDGVLVLAGSPGAWHWADGPAPSRWEVRGLPGRRGGQRRPHRISVHLGARRRKVAVRLDDAELARYRRHADLFGFDGVSPWLASLASRKAKPSRVSWSEYLREIGNREVLAAALKPA